MVCDSGPLSGKLGGCRSTRHIFSGRFAVFANGDHHDDTPIDPIGPTEPGANSTAVDSVRLLLTKPPRGGKVQEQVVGAGPEVCDK